MAQPGDGSKSLEKAAEDGPIVSETKQEPYAQTHSATSSTVTPDSANKEPNSKPTPGIQVTGQSDEDALYAHLPEHEKQVLKNQLNGPDVKASFGILYRYASTMDTLIMIVSAICAIAAGAALPLFTVSLSILFFGVQGWLTCLDSLWFSGLGHAGNYPGNDRVRRILR